MNYKRFFFRRTKRLLLVTSLMATAVQSAESNEVVLLPPFIVEEVIRGNAWTYSQLPGFEILSRCNDARTRELALSFHRPHELLRLILPDRFLVSFDVPKTLLFYDEALWDANTQEAMTAMLRAGPKRVTPPPHPPRRRTHGAVVPDWMRRADPSEIAPTPATGQRTAFFTNMMLTDTDSMAIFSIVPRASVESSVSYLTPSYVGHLLGRRTPKLSTWFEVGFLANYRGMKFSDDAIKLERMTWPSELAGSPLLPMENFLAEDALAKISGQRDAHQIWFAQAELFVRWALFPAEAVRTKAFWNFVERAAKEPVNEAMFWDCFGFGYETANGQLSAYLAADATKSLLWRNEQPLVMPDLNSRRATRDEIARIKGDWERLETDYVRKNLPEFEQKYLELARKTLRRGHEMVEANALLLAVEGLCEVDADNDAAGREFLEQAVSMGVVRPRVYCELARIRFEELMAKSSRNDGKISFESALELIELLAIARKQAPPQAAGYELFAAIWESCVVPPRPSDLAVLDEGMSLFPLNGKLVERAAGLAAASLR